MQTPFPLKAFLDNYIWIIPEEDFISCVDPGDANPVLAYAKETLLPLRNILLTHHHHDHIGGVETLLEAFPDCKVYSPVDARIPASEATRLTSVTIGKIDFEVLSTTGHTSSHISYYAPEPGWLFCGDTLFSAGCGRVFDGSLENLYASLNLYKNLPEDTLVFCAHEYTRKNLQFAHWVEPDNAAIIDLLSKLNQTDRCSLPSTIGLEKKINPFFRTHIPAVQDFALSHGASSREPLEVFRVLREEKNRFG